MTQTAIPYYFFRGGSSRGPYFKRSDLPASQDALSAVLVAALGSGHPLNIDGLGGGNAVTTKVAMLSKSEDDWADVDYYFAQVGVENRLVDYKPSCGNILVGVGPAAIEMGLMEAKDGVTDVKIHAINTGSKVVAQIQTPGGVVNYEGNSAVDGVPGTAAPITLKFMDVVGAVTDKFLPSGNLMDNINGIDVTCMDVAMPMVIARAKDFGLTGYESQQELDANKRFFQQMEPIRLAAGKLMGMGDCHDSVIPKFGLVAPAAQGGSMAVRYFMPWTAHPTLAVTGSQCLAACALTPGTVADGLVSSSPISPTTIALEHPMGTMDVIVDYALDNEQFTHRSAGLTRTARKLAKGELFVPSAIWEPASV